ncbi:hypothetical protein NIES2107_71850 (plasmid) [Nostoc carneum NIES-2107]|nr:hypothetical protein NIES2107_71850 [Nostoc carneum NIES-2107]
MRVLNIFPTGNNRQVKIVYVETLTKANILNLWVESRAYPDRYILADASDINELQQDVPPNEVTTLSEYLESKNIEVNKSDFHKLANLIVKLYKSQYILDFSQRLKEEGSKTVKM